MGIRHTQVIGLNERGRAIVAGEEVLLYRLEGRRIFPDGDVEEFAEEVRGSDVAVDHCGSFEGMFGEPYPLYRHTLPDGREFTEDVQETVWSSGPCIFLALRDEEGDWIERSLWSPEELEEMI